MKSFFLGCLFLMGMHTQAQISLIDFSSNLHQFSSFNGAVFNLDNDPVDVSNAVGKITNNGDVWEGSAIRLPVDIYLDSIKTLKIKVYKADNSATNVLVKLEDKSQTDDVEVQQSINSNGWSTVTFDFSQAKISGTNTTVNANGGYSTMVLFIDGGSSKIGTFYIDDIEYPNYESANSLDVIYTNLVYADEFSYFGPIDTSQWFPEEVPPYPTGWFNNEKQHYTARTDNVYLSNGSLKIVAKRETYNAYGVTLDYTSARLNSKYSFTYGRVDVRAKLPQGDGTWPAIWMLGTSYGNHWNTKTLPWPDCGEIDIMEHWGNDANKIHGSIHNPSSFGATVNTQAVLDETVFDQWHVYSMNWSPNQISFLIDGFLYYTYKPDVKNAQTWPFDSPQFLLLNVAMGGIYPIATSFVESQMEIDYVRVYQNNINVGENELEVDVSIKPNPASEFVEISSNEKGTFRVFDSLGRLFIETEIQGMGSQMLNFESVKPGNYIWQFEVSGKSRTGKLLVVD